MSIPRKRDDEADTVCTACGQEIRADDSSGGTGTHVMHLDCYLSEREKRRASPSARRGIVVVVDDEVAIRMLFQVTLEERGHVVTTAATAADALAVCATTTPDVVIVDMFLPEGSGLEVIKALRRTCPTARIIAITGGGTWGGFEVLATAKEAGADVTLRKPVPSNVIVEAVEGLLGTR